MDLWSCSWAVAAEEEEEVFLASEVGRDRYSWEGLGAGVAMLLLILAAARFGSVPVVTVGALRVWERAQRPGAAWPFIMVESLETRSDRFAIEFAGTTMAGTAEFPMVALLMSVPPDVDSPVPSDEGGAAATSPPPLALSFIRMASFFRRSSSFSSRLFSASSCSFSAVR